MKKININMDERTATQLTVEAEHRKTSLSAVIRLACDHWVDRHARSSCVNSAQPSAPVWSYMREVGGVYVITDSAGNIVDFGHEDKYWLSKRGSGSAGWQKCACCGEMFDAGVGSYFNAPIYLCSLCGRALLARQPA